MDPSGLFDMMEKWAYGSVDKSSLKFRDYKFHGAWVMIKKQGIIVFLGIKLFGVIKSVNDKQFLMVKIINKCQF